MKRSTQEQLKTYIITLFSFATKMHLRTKAIETNPEESAPRLLVLFAQYPFTIVLPLFPDLFSGR
ncbi:hypothetical protein CKO15_05655 [Halorhodospira abdelmalekii]|nr:hypothetical protein [Halorhodospira abdelmalekii]